MKSPITAGSLPLVGWGLMGAWGLVSLSLEVPAIPGGPTFSNAFSTLASIVACLLVLPLARSPRLNRAVAFDPLPWAVVMSACSAANQAAQVVGVPDLFALVFQCASSLAYIMLMYQWFRLYSSLDPQQVEEGAILSTGLQALVCLLAIATPRIVSTALWVALPPVSALCLRRARGRRTPPSNLPPEAPSAPEPAFSSRRGWITTIVAILVCGIVTSIPQNLGAASGVAGSPTARMATFGGVLVAAALSMWYVSSARRIDAGSLFKMLYPFVAACLFLSSVANTWCAVAGLLLGSAGQWALYVFMWVYASESRPQTKDGKALSLPVRFVAARTAFDIGGFLSSAASLLLSSLLGEAGYSVVAPPLLFGALALFVAATSPLLRLDVGLDRPDPDVAAPDIDALITQRADTFAKTHGMSEREAQILVLLLRGQSTATIRNELAIAKGTVDTYIQRIYRKCDVHSRQELMELVHSRS